MNNEQLANERIKNRQESTRYLLPATCYLLLALFATWPLITHLQGWVPGFGDWGQNMWALWWTRHALLVLAQSPFFTNYLFYPEGVTLLFHPLDVSDALLALPVYGIFGGDITYNVMILLSFVLGGWGTYLLALYLTHNRGAGFIAGLIFTLSPYHFLRIDLGHLNLSTVQWIPFYTLFLLKFIRQGSKRSAALAVFFLVFTALHSWYYVIYLGLLSLALIFWPQPGRTPNDKQQTKVYHFGLRVWRVAFVLIAAVIILLPLLIPMLQLLGSTTLIGEHNPLRHSVDALSFWAPGPPSTWAGRFENVWISYAAQNREPGASAYLGYTVLALALVGLISHRRRRQVLWWLVVALGFTLLALGPQLQIGGQILGMSLPYQWLENIAPIFSITGIPGRFVVMTSLALSIMAAYGLDVLASRLKKSSSFIIRSFDKLRTGYSSFITHHSSLIIYIVVGVLIIVEYLSIPLRLTPTTLNDFYYSAAADHESYSMLDIKWDANFLMHAQTVHGKPLVGGWLARLPEKQALYLDQQGGLDKVFLHLLLGPEGAELTDLALIQAEVKAELTNRNVRYIIDHDKLAGPWIEQLVGWPVVYKADGMVVYGLVQ